MTTTTNEETITTPDSILDQSGAAANPSDRPPTSRPSSGVIGLMVGVLAFGLLGGFAAGIQVSKSSGSTANAGGFSNQSQTGGAGGQGQSNMRGGFGTVTAINSDSITVKDQMQNSTTSFTITASTAVTDNGSTASVSDIAVGDTVMVQTTNSATSSSDTKTATGITINPSMQGGPGGQSQRQGQTQNGTSIN